MKNMFLNRVFKNYLLLFLVIFSTELIFRYVLNMPLLEWSLLRIFLGVNAISLILGILYSFGGRVVGNVLVLLTCFLTSLYSLLQAGLVNYLGVYVSFNTLEQVGAVKEYFTDFIQSFKNEFYLILIPIGLLIIYYLLFERKVNIKLKNRKYNVLEVLGGVKVKEDERIRIKTNEKKMLINTRVIFLIIALGAMGVYYYSLTAGFMQNELQLVNNKVLFNNPEMPNIAVNQFGISVFGLLDAKATMLPSDGSNINEEFSDGYVKPEQIITSYTRYIDDSAWEKLIANESNTNYKKLHNYYISKEITPQNDYTGMFAGKNLIVIMMESANNIIINEEYFPNIYKLYSEGWSWANNYSPRNVCAAGNNELSGMTSIFTINRACTANDYQNNTYFNSLFNLFNRSGYTTSSYHNYNESYYYRNSIHNNLGSMKYYDVDDLGITVNASNRELPSDIELMEKALDKILEQEHFMALITTVSSHLPYATNSELGDLYLDYFSDTNYNMPLKRYLSKLKVLDEAIGKLVQELSDAGKLDDTVIVLYSDHYPYGLSTETIESYYGYDVEMNYERDRTPFIIYNPSMRPTKYQEYTSFMNIVPTLANLFDLTYDPRLYSGFDILSDDYQNRIVFADGSWQSPLGFYDAATGKMNYYGDATYTNEEIIAINKDIMDNIEMSNLAITSNYFGYLGEKLKEGRSPLTDTIPFKYDEEKNDFNTESGIGEGEEVQPAS